MIILRIAATPMTALGNLGRILPDVAGHLPTPV
jgi:hypothetical protein